MRPGLDQMLKDATRRKFDVVPWPGAPIVSAARLTGVDLFLHQQAVDTTAPAVKAMFQMLGVFSEFERSMIQSRVKAGMARIKAGAPTKSGSRLVDPRLVRRLNGPSGASEGRRRNAQDGQAGRRWKRHCSVHRADDSHLTDWSGSLLFSACLYGAGGTCAMAIIACALGLRRCRSITSYYARQFDMLHC